MIFDNPELEREIVALLINWGYWSTQGMGMGGGVHPMFRSGVKPSGTHSVSEEDAMNADRCIARMKKGSDERQILFAAYSMRLDPHTIEIRTGWSFKKQRRILEFSHRLFWMYWDALILDNANASSQISINA